MKALSYKPAAYWRLDDTAPFQDYSGYNRVGTLSGTEAHGLSLSNNAAYSQRLSRFTTATFPSPIYTAGYETNPFTMTAVMEPVRYSEGLVGVLTNLALNPSCETLTNLGIYGTSTATRTNDSTKFMFGSKSIKVTIDSGAAQSRGFQTKISVTPGKFYNISAYGWSETTVLRINYIWRDAADAAIGGTVEPSAGHVIGAQWNRFSINTQEAAPVGAVSMDVRFFFASGIIGNWFNVDGILVTEGTSVLDYFDGTFPGCGWNGTAHNSTSTKYASGGPQQVLGNLNKMDGLTIEGTVVSFSTKYVSTGSATASFDIGTYRRSQITGVHTVSKNALYVDGVLVDEVDITDAQQKDVYDSPNTNLYSGASDSGQAFIISNIALFPSALNASAIRDIYSDESQVSAGDVPKKFVGESFDLSTATRTPAFDLKFDTPAAWNTGSFNNSSLDNLRVVSNKIGEYTIEGTWKNSIDLRQSGASPTYTSLYFDWEGQNVVIQYSTDGTAWNTVSKRTPVAGLSGIIFVRATTAPGKDYSYVANLRVFGYTSNVMYINGRNITYPAAAKMFDSKPINEFSHEWGVHLKGGTISFEPDAELTPKTIEVWIKPDNSSPVTRTGFTPNTIKINGGNNPLAVNEWNLVHYGMSSAVAGTFTFGGDIQIGQVAVYADDVTGVADKIYATYTGVPTYRITDSGIINIAESAVPVDVYALDWQIVVS